jgi:hypothetical protein
LLIIAALIIFPISTEFLKRKKDVPLKSLGKITVRETGYLFKSYVSGTLWFYYAIADLPHFLSNN